MKKIYKLPLLLVALLVTSLSATAHDFEVDGIYYNITDSTALTVEVTYSGDSYSSVSDEYSGEVIIPDSVSFNSNTYSVTAIGNYAFRSCYGLIKIIISNSVTTIGSYTFYRCYNLTSVIISKSVSKISNYIFGYCNALSSISVEEGNPIYDSRDNCNAIIETASNTLVVGCKSTIIPSSVTVIGNSAFSVQEELTNINIPNSVTTIKHGAFELCSNLTTITFSESVTTIEDYVFEQCRNLDSIIIPHSVTKIGSNVFSSCNKLSSIVVDSDNPIYDSRDNCNAIIETASNTLISGCKTTVIPETVTTITESAFQGHDGLTSITIPNSATHIGRDAFLSCGLTSIFIPKSVINIDYGAFGQCHNLNSIIVEDGNPVYTSKENCNAIIDTTSNTLIVGCNNTVIPDYVTTIGQFAFYGCRGFTSIEIPNSVTTIDKGGFWNCLTLTSVTIPNLVTSIGFYAFFGCDNLTSITSLNPEPPTCGKYAFDLIPTDCTLSVPFGAKGAYEVADVWKEFTNIVELSEDAGIDDIVSSQATEVARYDIHGRLLSEPTHGINIVVYSDGATRKELVK